MFYYVFIHLFMGVLLLPPVPPQVLLILSEVPPTLLGRPQPGPPSAA